jgi:threonine dehydrogenase-like Zn-dependent dehydrogenase
VLFRSIELAKKLGLIDVAIKSTNHEQALEEIKAATEGKGCEATIDTSGNPAGRFLGIQGTRQWGRFAFVGEGNSVSFEPSRDVMHKQLTLFGCWVTTVAHMEDLVERVVRWKIHPEVIVTNTFPLEKVADAYKLMDQGKCGKVAVVWPD